MWLLTPRSSGAATEGDSDATSDVVHSNDSPTRVLDFDQVVRMEKKDISSIVVDVYREDGKEEQAPESDRNEKKTEASTASEDLTPPSLSTERSPINISADDMEVSSRSSKKNRLKFRRVTVLPTLDETIAEVSSGSSSVDSSDQKLSPSSSAEEDGEGNLLEPSFLDQEEETGSSEQPSQSSKQEDSPSQTGALVFKKPDWLARRHSTKKVKEWSAEQVKELNAKAETLALTGAERKALSVYRKVLAMTKQNVSQIKKQLYQSRDRMNQHLPAAVAESIQSRLHKEWIEAGDVIANTRTMMSILYERIGEFDRAIACAEEAKATYQRQVAFLGKVRRRRTSSSSNGNSGAGTDGSSSVDDRTMERATAGIDEASVIVQRIKSAKDSFEDRKIMHQDVVRFREQIAAVVAKEKEVDGNSADSEQRKKELYRLAEEKLENIRGLEERFLGEAHPQVGDTLSILASLSVEQGDSVGALQSAIDAFAALKLSLGMRHPRTGEKLRDIARIYENPEMEIHDDECAIEYYRMALDVFRESSSTLAASSRKVGMTLNDMAVLHIRRHEYDTAIELLSDALESYEIVIDGDDKLDSEEISSDTVQIWRNLGECYVSLKEYESAVEAFNGALDVQRSTRKMYDTAKDMENVKKVDLSWVDDESIADTLRRLGNACAHIGKYSKCLMALGEAHDIHRASVRQAMKLARGRSNPDLPAKQDQLAHTLFCLAQVHDALGSDKRAVTLYSESLQFRLFSDAHKNEKDRANLVHCAMCLSGIGNVHLKNREYHEAFSVFRDALNYCKGHGVPDTHVIVASIIDRQKVAGMNLSDRDIREMNASDLVGMEKLAETEIASGNFDGAILLLRRIMVIRDSVIERAVLAGRDSSDELLAAAGTLQQLGAVLITTNEDALAAQALRDSLRLYEAGGMTPTAPCVDELRRELGRLEQKA